jgi:hypothetical protein
MHIRAKGGLADKSTLNVSHNSVCSLQVLSLALLYNLGLTVGNYQYLLQDLFHTTLLASCMALTGPAKQLSKERPLARVLSGGVILPVLGQVIHVPPLIWEWAF